MKIFSAFLLLILYSTNFAQNYREVKIYLNNISDVQQLINSGMEFDHFHFNKDKTINVFIDENDYSILQKSNFNYEVLKDDWMSYYSSLPVMNRDERFSALQKVERDYGITGFNYGSMGGFYTVAEVSAKLDEMFAQYPNLITQKISIGNSVEGRPIYMAKISDNPAVSENEPQVLYTALIHAREPESMEQMIFFMFYLLENYGTDPEVTYLVNNRELYFVPIINPDGYEYNHTMSPSGGYMWRKNKKDNNGNGSFQEASDGVDLNRNYGPMNYWNASNSGSSTSPGSETYRGTAPFSEPETQAIRDFIATKNLRCALNYHTYGNYLIYPYAALDHETPDSSIFREYAMDMTSFNGYTYGIALQTVGYSVRGSSDDYFYDGDVVGNGGKIIAMTPEVGSSGFWPSQSEIIPLAVENLRPNLYYAWAAGEFVNLINPSFSQQYFNPGDQCEISIPSLRNKGLSDASGVTLSLTSDNPEIIINNGSISIGNIPSRTSVNNSQTFSFTVGNNIAADIRVKMLVTVSTNGTPMLVDTLSFITGTPQFVFSDTTNNPLTLWTITSTPVNPHWEATTSTFYSSPASYTDSKTGNYSDNATVTMTLTNSIDLSSYQNPRLRFWTKYDIESNWDYGQVKISTNNGTTWIPLQGNYTEPGTGSFQPNGQPLYDGTQNNWVNEEINLSAYTANQVKLRFELKTDGSQTRDGWYVDDIGIAVYTFVPVELTSFYAKLADNKILLKWATASELNNYGFEIERKDGGTEKWDKIGFVNGKGSSGELSNYSFNDKSPLAGKSYYRLKQIDFDGSYKYSEVVSVEYKGVASYELSQNYPNPFNPSTVINYSIAKPGFVSLKIYNILGVEVAELVNEYQESGTHSFEFSTQKLKDPIGSGVYFYTLKAGDFIQTKKMLIVK